MRQRIVVPRPHRPRTYVHREREEVVAHPVQTCYAMHIANTLAKCDDISISAPIDLDTMESGRCNNARWRFNGRHIEVIRTYSTSM